MNGIIIFLCLFNISHISYAECSEVMSKRTQKDSGEERVTAKSKPMMNLVSEIIWYTTWLLCLKPWRFPQQEQQWIKNGRNLKRFWRGTWQVRSKSEVIDETRTSGAKVHFAPLMDMSFEKRWIGGKAPKKFMVELYSVVILSKTILDRTQYSPNKDLQHLRW